MSFEQQQRRTSKRDKTTRKFHQAFKAEYRLFLTFVKGIAHEEQRKRYAFVLLNRLMFVYFLQKKGLLAGDENYLAHRCAQLRQASDHDDTFLPFYHALLQRLFHQDPDHALSWQQAAGVLPYLHGELLEEHHMEQRYPAIQIADEAFVRIFAFFEQWQWRLESEETAEENVLHPEIMGSLFESFIKQKEIGAYYTNDEVTAYLAEKTIVSSLCDALTHSGYALLGPASVGQKLLRTDPARYCYPALQKGVDLALPPEIAAGITDVTRRSLWADVAPQAYALPTETWREVIERRERFEAIRQELVNGGVTSIGDFTSLNLASVTFLHDVLCQNQDAGLLWHFYLALARLTLLDPTCGSGAFLFAALNVLQPLYEVCLQQMAAFVLAGEQSTTRLSTPYLALFRALLQQVATSTKSAFFVLKSIIVNNIYGVDIKHEVVEICRMHLFLKLVAQLETSEDVALLPGIRFNIAVGNTLLGLATIDELRMALRSPGQPALDLPCTVEQLAGRLHRAPEAGLPARPFSVRQDAGDLLTAQLDRATQVLDAVLASEYGVDAEQTRSGRWQQKARPFHWPVRFYEIMQRGGFSVIIGNPPYVEYRKVETQYTVRDYATLSTRNLYALIMERSTVLLAPGGHLGMIVPSSATCTDGYLPLQRLLLAQNDLHIASFSDQRGRLFPIPHPRLCVIQYQKSAPGIAPRQRVYTTPYLKLERRMRVNPFEKLSYREATPWVRPGIIPRFGSALEDGIARKLFAQPSTLGAYVCPIGEHRVYYTRKLSWFVQVTPFSPLLFSEHEGARLPSELKMLRFASALHADIAFVALNSNLFYWLLTTGSDCRNLNKREVCGLPLCIEAMNEVTQRALCELARQLEQSLRDHSAHKRRHYKQKGTALLIQCLFPIHSKPIIDKIDHVLAEHYGFTAEETDFLIHYDGKYRHVRSSVLRVAAM